MSCFTHPQFGDFRYDNDFRYDHDIRYDDDFRYDTDFRSNEDSYYDDHSKFDNDDEDFYEGKKLYERNNDELLDEILKQFGKIQQHEDVEWNYEDVVSHSKRQQCNVKPDYRFTARDVEVTIQTLEVMANFFFSNSHQIITDGLFGMRLAEGACSHILERLEKSHSLYPKINALKTLLSATANIIYKNILNRRSKYDVRFFRIIDRPFNLARTWKNVNPNLIWKDTAGLCKFLEYN